LGLRIACVPDVCGAFFGWVLSEDLSAGLGYGFVASRSRLSQQGFELGEDLLDGIEVGRVFRQEHEARADVADRSSHHLSLVGAQIVEDHDIARLKRRDEELFDIGVEAFAVDGPVEQAGRFDAVVAQGGEESRGLPAAMRNLVDEALADGAMRPVFVVVAAPILQLFAGVGKGQEPGSGTNACSDTLSGSAR
jgi:hypothetical protein